MSLSNMRNSMKPGSEPSALFSKADRRPPPAANHSSSETSDAPGAGVSPDMGLGSRLQGFASFGHR